MVERIERSDEEAAVLLAENGALLLEIYDRYADVRKPNAEWERAALGCLARAQYTLRTVTALDSRSVDQITLARGVYEHSLMVAWLCIAPDAHFPRFLYSEKRRRERAMNELREYGVPELPEEDLLVLLLAGAGTEEVPKVIACARDADDYWDQAYPGWRWHFRRSYSNFYRYTSAYVHPTAAGLDPFLSKPPIGPFVISNPDTSDGKIAVAGAVHAFADALVVTSVKFGWPKLGEVTAAIARGFVKESSHV